MHTELTKLTHAELLTQRVQAEQVHAVPRHGVGLILPNIRSLYNVGALFRTADSALLSEIILCGYTPAPPRKEIEKTALGAVDTVPWRYIESAHTAIADVKAQGATVLALEMTAQSRSYTALTDKDFPLYIVPGNEITGVDADILALCDGAIDLPMYGVKHSLNVAIATGIAVYEAVRIFRLLQAEIPA
jgi:23S rRNA (guanosine2251-2'-O)-methyltransferase